jgi:hypothetical protein
MTFYINRSVGRDMGISTDSNTVREHQLMSIYREHIPYTYLVGWSSLNKYYYGVRFAKDCHPNEFWVKYFTSSQKVKHLRVTHGDPDIIQIRKTFKTKNSARLWEKKVLKRLDVLNEEKWLNENIAGATIQTPENNLSRSIKLKGKKVSEFTKKVASITHKGKILSSETKQKLSELNRGSNHPQYGMKSSEEKKKKISEKNKNNNQFILVCPHCSATGKGSVMYRHHFERCKSNA